MDHGAPAARPRISANPKRVEAKLRRRAISPYHRESFPWLGTSGSPAAESCAQARKRYAKEIPGERVQMDTCKIAPSLYQYTAIDDCTRIRVLALYKRRSAGNSLLFLEKVIEEFPFPIQRIQTDRGREFFAYAFQEKLMEYGIKFRPLKPASPHLNGKVERSQRTDLEEFYATVDLRAEDLRSGWMIGNRITTSSECTALWTAVHPGRSGTSEHD